MLLNYDEKACAVYFFESEGITREMLYSEFEALLDGVVSASDWSGRQAQAVYVEISSQWAITAAVFFRVAFDAGGAVEKSWRLPLQDLAKHAARGPDLGVGPISLACASHCPISYYAAELWDPDMRPGSNHFSQLGKAVKQNRLGLHFKENEEERASGAPDAQIAQMLEQQISQQLRRQYEKDFRDHMAQLLKEQRLKLSTLSSNRERALAELKREHNQRVELLRRELKEKQAQLSEAQERNLQLKQTIDGQANKIQGLREYFEHKLEKVQGEEAVHVTTLKQHHELELEAKIAAATGELTEALQMRDMELMYRNEQETQLREEIARLRRENRELLENSGNQLLHKLHEKGINFVTYQPGAGHITVPLGEISSFMDNPEKFAAFHSGVSLHHYQAWLQHYQAPLCQGLRATGELCHAVINRALVPADFHVGETDRCETCRGASPVQKAESAVG